MKSNYPSACVQDERSTWTYFMIRNNLPLPIGITTHVLVLSIDYMGSTDMYRALGIREGRRIKEDPTNC
jgi:hypothetical protein